MRIFYSDQVQRPSISSSQLVFAGDPRPSGVNAGPPVLRLTLSSELFWAPVLVTQPVPTVSPEKLPLTNANRAHKEEPMGYISWSVAAALVVWRLFPRCETRSRIC